MNNLKTFQRQEPLDNFLKKVEEFFKKYNLIHFTTKKGYTRYVDNNRVTVSFFKKLSKEDYIALEEVGVPNIIIKTLYLNLYDPNLLIRTFGPLIVDPPSKNTSEIAIRTHFFWLSYMTNLSPKESISVAPFEYSPEEITFLLIELLYFNDTSYNI